MGRSLRDRYIFFTTITILFIFLASYYWRSNISEASSPIFQKIDDIIDGTSKPTPTTTEPYPKYKPTSPAKSFPIVDNFPFAQSAHSASDLPPIPSWNAPPNPHVKENTPLFIGFTRNWRLLQQVVVSYITSGWPPEDIYVVENTGVMDSNKKGRLSLQNPFFLNHTRLGMLGVNVLVTPTLFTFAQLQSFYMFHSIEMGWETYFWSHMDVVSVSFEDRYAESHPTILPPSDPAHDYSDYQSIYFHCLNALREVLTPDPETKQLTRWAMRFFSYDRLALVNVASFIEVGGWDTLIPFYMTDCDMHARLEMAHFDIKEVPAGLIYDVASSLDDLVVLYRKTGDKVPRASFVDPNAVEEELMSIASAETATAMVAPEARVKRRDHAGREGEDDKKGQEAWENSAKGPPVSRHPLYTGSSLLDPDSTSTSTTSSSPTPKPLVPSTNSNKWEEDTIHSPLFDSLISVLDRMQGSKHASTRGRNTWQSRQVGGQGDPFYRDSEGFDQGIQMTIEHGRAVFREKWGHRDCDIVAKGLVSEDAWRVVHDWD